MAGIIVAPTMGAIGCCSDYFSASPITAMIVAAVVRTVAVVVHEAAVY